LEYELLGGSERTRIVIVGSIVHDEAIWTMIRVVRCERRAASTKGRVRFLWAEDGSGDIVGPRLRGSSRGIHGANLGRRGRNREDEGGRKEQDAK
jgi:hypothetical protein